MTIKRFNELNTDELNQIIEDLGIMHVTKSGRIYISGEAVNKSKAQELMADKGILFTQNDFPILTEKCKIYLKEKEKNSKIVLDQDINGVDNDETLQYIRKFNPYVDIVTGKIVFVDSDTLTIGKINPEVYVAKNNLGVSSLKELNEISRPAQFTFDPKIPKMMSTQVVSGTEILVFNLCTIPEWEGMKPTEDQMPEEVTLLFESVFANKEEWDYILEWIYYAVYERNHTFMCLLGSQGVGKELFATLVGHGVGLEFFEKVDNSILEEKFNSQLLNNRVIFYDEVVADDTTKINRLKQFTNGRIAYESKGNDARTIDNFSSGIIANNNLDAVAISPEDRRFSVPSIGTKALFRVFAAHYGVSDDEGRELVAAFAKKLDLTPDGKPHQIVVNFFHWLKKHIASKPTRYSPTTPLKGKYFYEICHSSMPLWMQAIVEYCRDHYHIKEIEIKDIRKTLPSEDQKTFPRNVRINKRLFSYRDVGDVIVGTVIRSSKRDAAIELSDEFIEYQETINNETVEERRERLGINGLSEEYEEINMDEIEVVDTESDLDGVDLL